MNIHVKDKYNVPGFCLYLLLNFSAIFSLLPRKRLGITVFQPRLKVCTFARTNYYEYGKQRQVQESP